MKQISFGFVFLSIISASLCQTTNRVLTEDKEATVDSYQNEIFDGEKYKYNFETSNGLSRFETGELDKASATDGVMRVQGVYSYPGPGDMQFVVTYVADENGYRPKIHMASKVKTIPEFVTDDRINSALLASLVGSG